ncbi:MAG: glycosyltransferase WbuB [Rhodospirillales bacterium]|nr:MAG: glycosyltransferase WbuB [Rhodospirillales bacterium]
MTILFHHRIASRDGQAVHMEALIQALREQGHRVVVAGPEATAQSAFGGEVASVARLKRLLPQSVYELLELGYSLWAVPRLVRAYRRERPDAVYERYNLFMLAGLWLRRFTGTPLLLEVNAPIFHERSVYGGLALKRLARWCEGIVWRGADRVLPVTDALAQHVRSAGVPDERILVIPNGSDTAWLASPPAGDPVRQRLGLDSRVVLGFTGFVRSWNRLDRVLTLIAEHGERLNLHLLLIGDGPARPELEAQAEQCGIRHRFTVTGVVAPELLASRVAAFDIALIPGVTPYASPLKLFEYMALARPIIAPDSANIREVLEHDANALLASPEDDPAFAAAILRLAGDPALRARLGAAARETIVRRGLTWADNAERVAGVVRALADGGPDRP